MLIININSNFPTDTWQQKLSVDFWKQVLLRVSFLIILFTKEEDFHLLFYRRTVPSKIVYTLSYNIKIRFCLLSIEYIYIL